MAKPPVAAASPGHRMKAGQSRPAFSLGPESAVALVSARASLAPHGGKVLGFLKGEGPSAFISIQS